MVDLVGLHKHFILEHLGEGEVAVDFTMGNGNDTLFLSRTVGEQGRVYAFDIQEEALLSTRAHLEANGAPENYELICASHHRVKEFVKEPIKAGMFNPGYLPGSGKKAVTTMRETTMAAVEAAIAAGKREADKRELYITHKVIARQSEDIEWFARLSALGKDKLRQ